MLHFCRKHPQLFLRDNEFLPAQQNERACNVIYVLYSLNSVLFLLLNTPSSSPQASSSISQAISSITSAAISSSATIQAVGSTDTVSTAGVTSPTTSTFTAAAQQNYLQLLQQMAQLQQLHQCERMHTMYIRMHQLLGLLELATQFFISYKNFKCGSILLSLVQLLVLQTSSTS